MEVLENRTDIEELKRLITEHVEHTGSKRGEEILKSFDEYLPQFKKIIPVDYKEILRLIAKNEETGADPETAGIEAFKEFVG